MRTSYRVVLCLLLLTSVASAATLTPAGSFDCVFADGEYGIETDGNHIFVSKWNSPDAFYRYNMDGAGATSFTVTDAIRDLAYDGTYFYGGKNSNAIYQMDLTAGTVVSTITAPSSVTVRSIAYDPVADGFWVASWSGNISLIDRTGAIVRTIPSASTALAGSAYDGDTFGTPALWLFSQSDTIPDGNYVDLSAVSLVDGALLFGPYDIANDFVIGTTNAMAGGLALDETTRTLYGMVQNQFVFAYQLPGAQQNTVIPEPATMTALAAGLLGILVRRRMTG